MNYGKAIRISRVARGLTQRQLAERLTIGASQLSLIEAGKRQPSTRALRDISKALAVPPHLLTLLASDPEDLKGTDSNDVADLAKALLNMLVADAPPPGRGVD